MNLRPHPNLRTELKFICNILSLDSVYSWMNSSRLYFNEFFRPRRVNSIYFDSFDYRAYEDNITGISDRSKVRIRWYGNNKTISNIRFEIKRKKNQFGWKVCQEIKLKKKINANDFQKIIDLSSSQLSYQNKLYLETYSDPSIVIAYDRKYFLSNDSAVRITIDTNQKFQSLNTGLFNIPNYFDDSIVVEIKSEKFFFQDLKNLISNFPLRATKNSKYVNGIYSYLI